MNTIHPDPQVVEMANELPMRSDLAALPLSPDSDIAKAQLLMRQSLPVSLSEKLPLVKNIKMWWFRVMNNSHEK